MGSEACHALFSINPMYW